MALLQRTSNLLLKQNILRHATALDGQKRGQSNEGIHSKYYPNTSEGIKERNLRPDSAPEAPLQTPYPPFEDGKNPNTGEMGGPTGPEPTRFGDWERKGRVTDF